MKYFARRLGAILAIVLIAVLCTSLPASKAFAVNNPQGGSVGLEGTISSPPPTTGATITSPVNGAGFTTLPITVSGICPGTLLVKVFSNNVFVGSTQCVNGSFTLQIDLFNGENDLVARVYDALDQAGPDSNVVKVNFNAGQFNPGDIQLISLTSNYARRGANPGSTLTWPIILSGGSGPYAISVDWGDNKSSDLISLSAAGTFNISHVYDTAGVYNIIIKATDKNGVSAFLQLVGVANGAITSSASSTKPSSTITIIKVLWAPAAIMIPLIIAGFWLGRKYELSSLRKHLERV